MANEFASLERSTEMTSKIEDRVRKSVEQVTVPLFNTYLSNNHEAVIKLLLYILNDSKNAQLPNFMGFDEKVILFYCNVSQYICTSMNFSLSKI